MSETQVLMTVFDFLIFFLGIISWKGTSLLNRGGCFSVGGASFLRGGHPIGVSVLMGSFQKKSYDVGVSTMANPMNIRSHKDKFADLYASEILLLLRKSYFLIIQAVKTTQNTFTQ